MTAALLRRGRGGKRKVKGKGRPVKSDYPGFEILSKQLDELDLLSGIRLIMDSKADLQNLKLRVKIDSGYWKDGDYTFKIEIPDNYPDDMPIVKCIDKATHPLINNDGSIALRFLTDKWVKDHGVQTIVNTISNMFRSPQQFIYDRYLIIAYIRCDNDDQRISISEDVYDIMERCLVWNTCMVSNESDKAMYSIIKSNVTNFQLK